MHLRILHLLLLLPSALIAASADRVVLSGGNKLSGQIVGITDNGRVTLESDNAAAPLVLRQQHLESLVLAPPSPFKGDFSEVLFLSNGDRLPGTLTDLDGQTLGFETDYADALSIPRAETTSLDFGARPQRLVYQGPGDLKGWEKNDNWQLSGNTITSTASGSITHPGILPEQFILRFRIEWEGNPSLRFYFCDDLLKTQGATDRYSFDFNSTGMHIKRQTEGDDRGWGNITSIPRRPGSFPDEKVDVELRVDREQGLIYVYLDGNPEGRYRDHISQNPTGSGLMIQSLAGRDMKNIISRIEVFDWDAVSQIRSDEGHDDEHLDSLIATNGERFSGSAESLALRDDGSRGLVFTSPHSDDSFLIPKDRISTLYFRLNAQSSPKGSPLCKVALANSGVLHLLSLTLTASHLTGTHPLLGGLSIRRDAVSGIEFLLSPNPKATEAPNE